MQIKAGQGEILKRCYGHKVTVKPVFIKHGYLENISPLQVAKGVLVLPGIVNGDVGVGCICRFAIAHFIAANLGYVQIGAVFPLAGNIPFQTHNPINRTAGTASLAAAG